MVELSEAKEQDLVFLLRGTSYFQFQPAAIAVAGLVPHLHFPVYLAAVHEYMATCDFFLPVLYRLLRYRDLFRHAGATTTFI